MTVLVTGGSSGLGAALAGAFLARGDEVLITDEAARSAYDLKLNDRTTT